jgi:hypothetical protein
MSTATIAALLLIAVPLAFNAAFTLLAARFDYPDILRNPPPTSCPSSAPAAPHSC